MSGAPRSSWPIVVALAVLIGCGGGGGGGGGPVPAPTPVPTGTPTATASPGVTPTPTIGPAGQLVASPGAIAVNGAGAAAAAGTFVQETGYTGAVAQSNTCAGIATIAPASGAVPSEFTATGIASGTCTITFSDTFGQTAHVGVTVTISGVTVL